VTQIYPPACRKFGTAYTTAAPIFSVLIEGLWPDCLAVVVAAARLDVCADISPHISRVPAELRVTGGQTYWCLNSAGGLISQLTELDGEI
jgi:hypothetical protein